MAKFRRNHQLKTKGLFYSSSIKAFALIFLFLITLFLIFGPSLLREIKTNSLPDSKKSIPPWYAMLPYFVRGEVLQTKDFALCYDDQFGSISWLAFRSLLWSEIDLADDCTSNNYGFFISSPPEQSETRLPVFHLRLKMEDPKWEGLWCSSYCTFPISDAMRSHFLYQLNTIIRRFGRNDDLDLVTVVPYKTKDLPIHFYVVMSSLDQNAHCQSWRINPASEGLEGISRVNLNEIEEMTAVRFDFCNTIK